MESEWISVRDMKPEREQRVLCYSGYIQIKVFDTYCDSYIFYDGDTHCYCPIGQVEGVTHWMPLPKPPKDPDWKEKLHRSIEPSPYEVGR